MKLLIATSNPHKIEEILAIAEALGTPLELIGLKDTGLDLPDPIEDQPDFAGNALLKARYYAKHAKRPCIADDSGLEVDALGGAPGVKSARYAGRTGPRDVVDPANNKKLIEALGNTPADQRQARFVCAMALVWPDHEAGALADAPAHAPIQVRGTFEGRIITPDQADDPSQPHLGRGGNGFGYDPLFWLEARGCTSAELSPADKNAVSHRGDATRKLIAAIRTH